MIYPNEAYTRERAASEIARHYDELDRWYLEVWGEHVHHGLWDSFWMTQRAAVRNLTRVLAQEIGVQPGWRICDAGCGYGATSRMLAEEYGAEVVGLTLSQRQYDYAAEKAKGKTNPTFRCQNFFDSHFDEASFDAAISIESSEHMDDKAAFFQEFFRILKPGGRTACYAWLACDAPEPWREKYFLEPICREGRLPHMGDVADYRRLLDEAGFVEIRFDDYSDKVKGTWPLIIWRMCKRLAWDQEARDFVMSGPENRLFAKTCFRIWFAYELGIMRYGLFTARKPA